MNAKKRLAGKIYGQQSKSILGNGVLRFKPMCNFQLVLSKPGGTAAIKYLGSQHDGGVKGKRIYYWTQPV